MAITLTHNDLVIEAFDDLVFFQTAGDRVKYDKIYRSSNAGVYVPTSQHGIIVSHNGQKLVSAILLATGGATSVSDDSVIIDNDRLVARCCNTIFCLSLPELDLQWMTEADWATCFSIHQYQDTYITHGELSISRIDRKGEILWSYRGSDIFVCLYEGTPFEMHPNHITLTDFNGSKYKIDYDGNSLSYEESDYHKQEPVTVLLKPAKPWWKFW